MGDYLVHYGVKGMRWGVRNAETRAKRDAGTKHTTSSATSDHVNKKVHITQTKKYDKILKGLAITAGVSAAAVVGFEAYKHGLTYGDKIIKAGTLVQNIAPEGRKFNTSFYGAVDQDDRRQFLKNFVTSDRNVATIFKADKDVKIAGRKAMDQAYDELLGTKTSWKEKTRYFQNFGALPENEREAFIEILRDQGYNGFKDVNDILINWGNTPTVFFGDKSGLKAIKSVKVDPEKTRKIWQTSRAQKRAAAEFLAAGTAYVSGLSAATMSSIKLSYIPDTQDTVKVKGGKKHEDSKKRKRR